MSESPFDTDPRPLALIVDQSRDFRTILAAVLNHEGFDAIATADPDEALELARARKPAVIVGEHPLMLRGGGVLCAVLLEDPRTASVPFVAVTARAFDEDLQSARRTHRYGVFTKPVAPRRVAEHIGNLLRKPAP